MSYAAACGVLAFHRPAPSNLTPPAAEGQYEPEIQALNPGVYLKFGGDLSDSSGAGRNGTLVGTGGSFVAALPANVGAGNTAFDTEGTASVSIAHSAVPDTALSVPSGWGASVQSTDGFRFVAESTISCWFKINAMPTGSNKAVIFAKSHTAQPGDAASYAESTPILAGRGSTVNGGSFAAYFDANGAVHVDMRSFRGRPCIVRTPDGAVALNGTYHLVVQLGYDGVTAWLDGAKFEDGYANLAHVYGLCANIRGAVFRNSYAWTIGKAAWGGQADIIVDEFAVFHRAPSATLSQANVNTLAQQGSTPAALAHHIWGRLTVNASSFASIQAAIDNVTGSGGGTVLVNPGSYTQNVVLKSNVRLKANGGTVTINGRASTATLSVSTITDNATNFMTGDRTLDVTNSRSVGDIIKILGTQGSPVSSGTSPMRHDRRWNTEGESNDKSVPDAETFEIESRTGSEITMVGAGSTYDFASGDRQVIHAWNPTKWTALEGDLRFSAAGDVVTFTYCNYARVVGITATNTGGDADSQCMWCSTHGRNVQFRSCTSNQKAAVDGSGSLDGIAFWLGSADCVAKDCTVTEGRHGGDAAGNHNSGPALRCEFHNVTWVNNESRTVGGRFSAFGVHGTSTDCIYWHCNSNYGGPAATGWKHCSRWMVCGDPNVAGGGALHIEDGGLECSFRDLHIKRPELWFGDFEGTTSVDKCHFEQITRTSTSRTANVHTHNYGTGALANTQSGTVDEPHASWVAV